jgi:UTP--glucose-1-phosphate uridylyltransferase
LNIKKAIIPVAGFGTRLLPATKAIPKAMLPLVDKPVIHYLVEEAVASGIEEIAIITGSKQKEIDNYFKRSAELERHLTKIGRIDLLEAIEKISSMARISYVKQVYPRGLGHAILCAREFIGKDKQFAVLLGDDIIYSPNNPCLLQMIKAYEKHNGNIIGAMHIADELISFHGIIMELNFARVLLRLKTL